MDKAKTKVDITAEELERLLLHKEGESVRDNGVQGRSPGVSGAGGKRVIGKAVAKGGMLLKGKNPGNVCHLSFPKVRDLITSFRFNDKKMTFVNGCPMLRMRSEKRCMTRKQSDKSISTFNFPESSGYACCRLPSIVFVNT